MILKEKHSYGVDDSVSYSLIDNVEKVEVGNTLSERPIAFINVFLKNRKDPKEYRTIEVTDTIVYICNDQGKTLEKVVPNK